MASERGKSHNNVRETWERNEREDGIRRETEEDRALEQTIAEEATEYDAEHNAVPADGTRDDEDA